MANSEFRAAFRIFYREKAYALINLSGLSMAIACFLILGLYLRSELTYDRHNLRHKEIFRIVNEFTAAGSPESFAYTSFALGPLLKRDYPEVKNFVRFRPAALPNKLLIRTEDNKAIYWDNIWFTDPNVFDIFTHKIIYGDPKTALKDPSSAAVSESFARKYFGDANPIGKTILAEIAPQIPRKITLVFSDLPENTHLKYDALFYENTNFGTTPPEQLLFGVNWLTYLVMPENYNVDRFKLINDSFWTRYMKARGEQSKMYWKSWLQPLADIHLYSEVGYDLPTGNRYYVYGFSAVAIFILLVACINHINLAIARAAKRAKEIGMRKILGVPRSRLISRFLAEALFFAVIATLISAALVELVLKLTPINVLLGKPLVLDLKGEPILLLYMLGVSLLVGLLSGSYPALYLSSIRPISALASSLGGKGGFRLREMLVLIQFTVSVIVIACTIIMASQIRYITGKPLGFDKQHRIIINLRSNDVVQKYDLIKNDLSKNSHILGVAACSGMVGTGSGIPFNTVGVDNNEGVSEAVGFNHIAVTDNYLDVMGMKLVTGRDFSKRLLTDIGGTFVVNEAMVKTRGWQQPLGKRIQGINGGGKVIGVVNDFHVKSLHSQVEPFVMYQFRDVYPRTMIVKISDTDILKTVKFLQDTLAAYDPRHPFEYRFLDDVIDNQYLSDNNLMRMTGIFSGICIFISCLGLFGLAAFATEQRNKEIGIRKVLGASASQIIIMLAKKTLWLVLAGSVVASIVAYYAMDEWLSGFAYRTTIYPLIFLLSAVVVIMVAFVTIVLQSYRAAQANPALMIRYE